MCRLCGKFFANSDALLTLGLPIHNQALVGDEITTLSLNHEWRRIVTSALQYYFQHGKSTLALDNEDLLDDVLEDIYTAEAFGMNSVIRSVMLTANQSRNQTTFATVPGSTVSYVPTKSRAKISISNIRCGLDAGGFGSVRVGVSAGDVVIRDEYGANSSTARNVRAAAIFENMPIGVSVDVFVEFAAASGDTITVFRAHNMLIEIDEQD